MKHKCAYIICATPRSGSTLLCDLLTDTGIAGRPDSFFNFESFDWPSYLNVSTAGWRGKDEFDHSYLSALLKYGTYNTSVFGMRLMWETLGNLSNRLKLLYPDLENDRARFSSAFGAPVYLHLSRKNKIAQAVSNLRAQQTGLWHVWADGSERERLKPKMTSVYDYQKLVGLVKMTVKNDAAWVHWFVQQGVKPVSLTYEALAAQPQRVLATTLAALGLDPAFAENIKPKTFKLADSESDEWIARFQQESGCVE